MYVVQWKMRCKIKGLLQSNENKDERDFHWSGIKENATDRISLIIWIMQIYYWSIDYRNVKYFITESYWKGLSVVRIF